jgi:hypothetical protein
MADIALTAARIAPVFPSEAEVYDFVAAVAVTRGQLLYQTAAGLAGLADGNDSGTTQPIGLALNDAAAGQAVSVFKKGHLAGFTLTSINPGTKVFISNTAGAVADAVATLVQPIGQVVVLSDKPDYTKCIFFDVDWTQIYST